MGTVEFRLSQTGDRMVAAGFSNVERAARKAGLVGAKAGMDIGKGFSAAHGAVTRLGAAIGLASIAGGVKKILDYTESLGRLQAAARLSNTEIKALQDRIEAAADKYGESNSAVTGMVSAIGSSREAVNYAKEAVADLVAVMDALNVEGEQVGAWAKNMAGLGVDPRRLKEMAGLLKNIGQAGNVPMEKKLGEAGAFARQGKGKFATGERAVQQLGGLYALMGGDEGQAQQVLKAINKKREHHALRPLTQTGKWGDIPDVLGAVMKATGGRRELVSGFLGVRAKRADELAAMWDVKGKRWKPGSRMANIFGVTSGAGEIDQTLQTLDTGAGKNARVAWKAKNRAVNKVVGAGGADVVNAVADDPWLVGLLGAGGYAMYKSLTGGKGAPGGAPTTAAPGGRPRLGPGSSGARNVEIPRFSKPTGRLGPGTGAGLLGLLLNIPEAVGRVKMTPEQLAARDAGEAAPGVAALQARALAASKAGLSGAAFDRELQKEALEQRMKAAEQMSPGVNAAVGLALQKAIVDLTAQLRRTPPVVKVVPGGGLDSPDVKGGRGPKK